MDKKARVLSLILVMVLSLFSLFSCAGLSALRLKLSGAEVYERVEPSTVAVIMQDGSKKAGSGFFIDAHGKVLTSYHVVSGGGDAIIQLSGGSTASVTKILAFDEAQDLAILETTAENTAPAKLSESDARVGDTVYALGYPQAYVLGTVTPTFTVGIVSAMREHNGLTYVQTSADVTAGNSGGALINEYGEIVGVVASSISISGVDYMNLAVPVSVVRAFACEYLVSAEEK